MLTLADSLRVAPFTLFRDVVYRDGQRSYTPRFYALPDAPRLARDERGGPAFDFLWYRVPPGRSPTANSASPAPAAAPIAAPTSGGLVTLTVELAPTAEERASLAAAVVQALPALAAPGPAGSGAIEILSMPFDAGTVALAFAGETGGGDFASRIAGSGPARFSGTERATFSVELTAEGAALLSQAIDAGQDLFHARYDLTFEHRLDDVVLRVWCDARRSYDALAAGLAAGPLALPKLYPTLAVQHLAGVELTAPAPLAPEHEAALRKLGEDLLTAALKSAFFIEAGGVGGAPGEDTASAALGADRLRPFAPEIEATLNHTFSESFPAEQRAALEGTIRVDKDELADRLRRIDLDGGFFRILEVKIYCTVDFANDLIETVKARLDYDVTGPSGRVQTSGEYLFREGTTVATFRTALAAPEERKVSCEVEIFYRASAGNSGPRRIAYPAVDGTAIVLDLDRLGVLTAGVALRDVPLSRVRSAVVELEYPADALSDRLILDGERPAGVWQAAVRDETAGPWRYRVSWLTGDDRRVEQDWQTAGAGSQAVSGSAGVPLDAPRELLATARVMVVAAGDFSDLAQVVVDLAAESGGQAYQTQMAFAQPGGSQVWEPPVADRAAFRYRARRTLVYADGGVRALDWTDEDAPVLVVRDLLRVDVQVIARLLDIRAGGAYAFALLALEHGDTKATLVIRDPAAGAQWSFRLAAPLGPAAPGAASYRWQLTLVPAQGPRVELPWQETDSAVLVLRPPSAQPLPSPPSPPPPPAA